MNITLGASNPGQISVNASASQVPKFQTIATGGPPYKKSQSLNRQVDVRSKNTSHVMKNKFSPNGKNFAPRLTKHNADATDTTNTRKKKGGKLPPAI